MIKKILPLILITLMVACKSHKDSTSKVKGDNSMSSLDWNGSYLGTTPCADCSGLKTLIVLNEDLTFTKKTQYLDKQDDIQTTSGSFTWNKAGNMITLDLGENSQSYKVGENFLIQLDASGKIITGDLADRYIFQKQTDNSIKNKPWRLVELNGKPIGETAKQPYLLLSTEDNRVSGNSSCNGFGGEYIILEGNRISFSKLMHTMMACPPNMTVETEFMKVLEVADNYTKVNGVLNLNKGRMATMAKFEVDYFVN